MTRHGERLQTGAAASATALVEALKGLFSVICITLSDESTAAARSTGVTAQQSAASLTFVFCHATPHRKIVQKRSSVRRMSGHSIDKYASVQVVRMSRAAQKP